MFTEKTWEKLAQYGENLLIALLVLVVWLYIYILCAEKLLGSFSGKLLYLVHALAASLLMVFTLISSSFSTKSSRSSVSMIAVEIVSEAVQSVKIDPGADAVFQEPGLILHTIFCQKGRGVF